MNIVRKCRTIIQNVIALSRLASVASPINCSSRAASTPFCGRFPLSLLLALGP